MIDKLLYVACCWFMYTGRRKLEGIFNFLLGILVRAGRKSCLFLFSYAIVLAELTDTKTPMIKELSKTQQRRSISEPRSLDQRTWWMLSHLDFKIYGQVSVHFPEFLAYFETPAL